MRAMANLGFRFVILVVLSRVFPAGTYGGNADEVLGSLPVYVQVAEYGLSAPCYRLLRVFVYEYLRQLVHPSVVDSYQIGGQEHVDRIPSDRAGIVALEGRGEFDDLFDEDFRVFGGLRDGHRVGKVETELLHVFDGLPAAVGAVDHPQVVEMDQSRHVCIGHVGGENFQQGEFLFDVLGEGEVGGFGAVGNVGVFLVGGNDYFPRVVNRNAQTGVLFPYVLQTPFHEFRVGEFAYEGCRNVSYVELFHHAVDIVRDEHRVEFGDIGLTQKRAVDSLLIPFLKVVVGRSDEKPYVRGF